MKTAREAGLVSCHFCHTLAKMPTHYENQLLKKPQLHCPCCRSVLHSRIPHSMSRTTALLLAALFLYIPANLLPIMTVVFQGVGEPDTIMQGVFHLLEGGMWPLALIVFVASIVVPVLKLLVLSGLLISIRLHSHWNPV